MIKYQEDGQITILLREGRVRIKSDTELRFQHAYGEDVLLLLSHKKASEVNWKTYHYIQVIRRSELNSGNWAGT